MTGPSLAPLNIPIAGTLFLTVWLTLVFSSPQRSGDVPVVFEVER